MRNEFKNVLIQGESSSADTGAAAKYPDQLKKIIEEGGYSPDQIFNADETALFWKRMPQRTYIAKNQKSASGHKSAKERICVLLCSNAAGTLITKPFVINKSLNPRAFKGIEKNHLPVHFRANSKAWMTTSLFLDWFNNCFCKEVEEFVKKKNQSFNILLILDNCSSHPQSLSNKNVRVEFLPPNTTSVLQPLDQGIIFQFKQAYLKMRLNTFFVKLKSVK